ncbi:MAG: hypothetical protein RIM84_20560 [Alphaproteobacteria bacterium]
MEQACEKEIVELHDFLRDWLAGALPRTPAAFARFKTVMGDGLQVISPRGTVTGQADILSEFEAAHGAMRHAGDDFRIWVENCRPVRKIGDHALLTYEEWHAVGDDKSARLTTVLFGPREGAPNGVAWLHVHETWLPDLAPAAGERFPEPA